MILGSAVAAEVAAGLAAVCLVVLAAGVAALVLLVRAVRGVQASLDRWGEEALPALAGLRRLRSVSPVLDLGAAGRPGTGNGAYGPDHGPYGGEAPTGEAGRDGLDPSSAGGSRLAWLALSEPLIKLLAAGSGAAEAARSFRHRRGG